MIERSGLSLAYHVLLTSSQGTGIYQVCIAHFVVKILFLFDLIIILEIIKLNQKPKLDVMLTLFDSKITD